MEKGRLAGMFLILIAFMVPIMTSVIVTGDMYSLCGVLPMLFVFVWAASTMAVLGVNVVDFLGAALVTLLFGILLAVLIVITANSGVVWLTAAMALVMIAAYRFI